MNEIQPIADWTQGSDGIAFQTCPACSKTWYFERRFCPNCGASEPVQRQASGLGIVQAVTVVTRAPSEELRAAPPYVIVLVDADEGFRLMAHGDKGLAIGDRVRCRYVRFGANTVPHFARVEQ
jgi:uncharacterized protein